MLDCSLGAGSKYEVARQVTFSVDGDVVAVSIEGNTGYLIAVPRAYRLTRTSPMLLAFTTLSKKSFGNRSSETGHLSALVEPLAAEADRRGAGAAEIDALIARFGIDPRTLPLDLAIKLRDKVQEINMMTMRFPDARAELLEDKVRRTLEDAGILAPP